MTKNNYFKIFVNDNDYLPEYRLNEIKTFMVKKESGFKIILIPQTQKMNKKSTIENWFKSQGIKPRLIIECSYTINPNIYTKRQMNLINKTLNH